MARKPKPDIDILSTFKGLKRITHTFSEASAALKEDWQQKKSLFTQGFHDSIVPAIVMVAFACELGMKSLYHHENGKWHVDSGHQLKGIFGKLSTSMQDRLRKKVCTAMGITETRFVELLEKNNKAFEEWRYFFEKNQASANYEFLLSLRDAIQQEVEAV